MSRKIDTILMRIREGQKNVRYSDLSRICDHYFGTPRQKGTNHRIYKTPWQGDPRINIQNDHGKTKSYQVRQVLMAIDKLEGRNVPEG